MSLEVYMDEGIFYFRNPKNGRIVKTSKIEAFVFLYPKYYNVVRSDYIYIKYVDLGRYLSFWGEDCFNYFCFDGISKMTVSWASEFRGNLLFNTSRDSPLFRAIRKSINNLVRTYHVGFYEASLETRSLASSYGDVTNDYSWADRLRLSEPEYYRNFLCIHNLFQKVI